MKSRTHRSLLPVFHLALFSLLLASDSSSQAAQDTRIRRLFREPTAEFSTGPLWVWNDMMTDAQVRGTLRDLASQHVKQVWIHPRPGLMTEYLSREWFRLWNVALFEARELGMNVWIYDENSYPSGFAGGWVPELMPSSRGQGLAFKEAKVPPRWSDDLVGIFQLEGPRVEDVTLRLKEQELLPEAAYLTVTQTRAPVSSFQANRWYVNLLSPGVTEKFIEVTLERYRREVGKEFGKRVPGIFTDEPHVQPAEGYPWSENLADEFQKRWGYSLLDHLPSLRLPVGDWRKVRHNYFQVVHEQFVRRWARPNFEFCATNNLEWTGHYWEHEWPRCTMVPDNMAMYAWHQRPAIDCLFNQYAENTHAQFGNVRMVRELSSAANQLGWRRTLCEIYGGAGWDLRFADMKRIGDWLSVLGVNTMNQHLSFATIRGTRKRDYPPSFSYHEPWWEAYHVSADYFARLSVALSQGEQLNNLLVLEPTTTAWMYQGDDQKLSALGGSFFKLLMQLEGAQVEYDLGSEDILAGHGSVRLSIERPANRRKALPTPRATAGLQVGERTYTRVVLPAELENLNASTLELLEKFLDSGGEVLCLGRAPTHLDGAESKLGLALAARPTFKSVSAESAPQLLAPQYAVDGLAIQRRAEDKGMLFHQRRRLADGEFLFLVNTSLENSSFGIIESVMNSVEVWDPYSGGMQPYPFDEAKEGVRCEFELPPCGSLLLFLDAKPGRPARRPVYNTRLLPGTETVVRRVAPNVLTLDYVDVTAGAEAQTNLSTYEANRFIWRKHGFDVNPWEHAVQFRKEILERSLGGDRSGFEAVYRFRVNEKIPADLAVVIERPDLYQVTLNNRKLRPVTGQWWLDRSFGRISIADAAKLGENVLTLRAGPMTMYHELESVYILGSFALTPVGSGFIIGPDQPLRVAPLIPREAHGTTPEDSMWLSAGVGFSAGVNDREPFLVFDLGEARDLDSILVWNYNENRARDLTSRGVSKLRVSLSTTTDTDAAYSQAGVFDLAQATGWETEPDSLAVRSQGARFVRFDILSNHAGIAYPAVGEPADNGFVGLSEVGFINSRGERIPGVKVARFSSELAAMKRTAARLVDGSGLALLRSGWNKQGHPFYADAVAYAQAFDIGKPAGRYLVSLPDWNGTVARVQVNGIVAGYIDAPPWDCDVTRHLKPGLNQVEVAVFGSLKNTLGPHHGSQEPGLASPWHFRGAKSPGPPPGIRYASIAYGLFAPFELKEVTRD